MWEAGPVTLQPDQVGAFMGSRGPDEDELAALDRQADFWRTWLDQAGGGSGDDDSSSGSGDGDDGTEGDGAVEPGVITGLGATGDDKPEDDELGAGIPPPPGATTSDPEGTAADDEAPPDDTSGFGFSADSGGTLGRFLRGLGRGPDADVLPVTPVETGATVRYRPDDSRISEVVADAVPYPLSPAPGARVRVRLLNGTTDPGLTASAARLLVGAGAEITIAGNASSFTIPETTLTYSSPDEREGAERLADAVGAGRVEESSGGASGTAGAGASAPEGDAEAGDGDDDEIDVTIVLGADVQDLIGRLENAG
jgi:hypothetical protein